jgi:hypothetical protein
LFLVMNLYVNMPHKNGETTAFLSLTKVKGEPLLRLAHLSEDSSLPWHFVSEWPAQRSVSFNF